jgi:Flp pilus assembly protein CpaB
MIGHPSDVGLPVRLKSGMRAVSVQIDKVKGVSGLIQPGDYVDVIADPPKAGPQPPPASAILRGVRVLAIGESLENTSATPSPQEANSTTVTLEVTPKQADLLVMADLNATLRLALRSPKEPLNSEPVEALHFSGPIDAPSDTNSGPSNDSPVQAMAMALKAVADPKASVQGRASAPSADPPGSPVTVIDGDHYSGAGGASSLP